MAHIGHPLLGDATYGDPALAQAAERHMLHAAGVRFEEISVACPDAADFSQLLERLRGS